jgi:hypothetical protein
MSLASRQKYGEPFRLPIKSFWGRSQDLVPIAASEQQVNQTRGNKHRLEGILSNEVPEVCGHRAEIVLRDIRPSALEAVCSR